MATRLSADVERQGIVYIQLTFVEVVLVLLARFPASSGGVGFVLDPVHVCVDRFRGF